MLLLPLALGRCWAANLTTCRRSCRLVRGPCRCGRMGVQRGVLLECRRFGENRLTDISGQKTGAEQLSASWCRFRKRTQKKL